MLTILSHFVAPEMCRAIEEWIPRRKINSFDCARFSMGVVQLELATAVCLPRVATRGYSLEDRLTILEAHMRLLQASIDGLLRPRYIAVWNLGPDVHDAWEVAPPLRSRLDRLDRKYGVPDCLLYEFQMGANDKSRMVSTMLSYHYAQRPDYPCQQTVRIAPAVKNTLCPARALTREEFLEACPEVARRRMKNHAGRLEATVDLIYRGRDRADLSIQTFLEIVTDTYRANKLHTSACLEWWSHWFSLDLQHVPRACLDDAADAFMQCQAALRRRLI